MSESELEIEQIEILGFLQRHSPFMELSLQEQTQLAKSINVSYFKAGSHILEYNAPLDALYLIRSGLVETYRRNGALYNRLSEGGIFAERGTRSQIPPSQPMATLAEQATDLHSPGGQPHTKS